MKKAFAFVASGLAALALAASTACDIADPVDDSIVTSITIRATDVTSGLGCGTAPGQVYKYTVVAHPVDVPVDAGTPAKSDLVRVADCFADTTLFNAIVQNASYVLDVSLFDKASFDTSSAAIAALEEADEKKVPLPPRGAVTAGAFGAMSCQVTARYQVQAFASCTNPQPTSDASVADASSVSDASDASDASTTDASTTDASDAGIGDAADAGD